MLAQIEPTMLHLFLAFFMLYSERVIYVVLISSQPFYSVRYGFDLNSSTPHRASSSQLCLTVPAKMSYFLANHEELSSVLQAPS